MSKRRGGSWYRARRQFRDFSNRKRSEIEGVRPLRRLFKQLPDSLKRELVETLDRGGKRILAAQRASARRKTGAMVSALSMRVYPARLDLKVGFIGKRVNRKLFYAKILGGGRKAQTVEAKRKGSSYSLRVKARGAEPVIDPPRAKIARAELLSDMDDAWTRVLSRAAGGDFGD